MSGRIRRWVAPVVLVLATVAFHGRELLGGRPYWRDVHLAFVPVKRYLGDIIASGQLPEWWPFDGLGMPLLAQPTFSVLHPVSLLYGLFSFWEAFTFELLLSTALAALGTFLVARSLKLPRPAALVAGGLYAFNGYVACLTEFSSAKLGASTLPWYVWALLVAARRGGAYQVLPSVAMALLLFAGEPQIALLAAGCGLVLVVFHRRLQGRALVLGAVSPAIGALLAAPQLLPSLAVAHATERVVTDLDAGKWPLSALHLAGLVFPIDLGPYEFTASTSFGLAALVLACASVVAVRRLRWVAAAWGVVAVSMLLAAGQGFGLHELARAAVPMWKHFRYPVKSILPALFCLSLLAGAGLAQLGGARRRAAMLAGLGGGAAAVSLFVAIGSSFPSAWASSLVLGTTVLVLLPARGARRWGAPILLVAALVVVASPLMPMTDASFYEPSPVARLLEKSGVSLTGTYFERLETRPRTPKQVAFINAAGAGGAGTSYGAIHGLPSPSIYLPGGSVRVRRFYEQHADGLQLAPVLGVGVLVMAEPVPPHLSSQVIGRDPEWGYSVVRLRRSLPRAYAVHRGRVAPDPASALSLFTAEGFKPGREVILEASNSTPAWSTRPDERAIPADIVGRTNTTVTLEVELPWDGFVVLNEAWFPGWTALVDGTPADVMPANGMVRAVEVPAGAHRVEFVYRTPGLSEGLTVSGATFVGLVLLAFFLGRRGRTEAAPRAIGAAAA